MQKSFGAVNIDIPWNSVKEHVLHNFAFLAQVNQVVNKDLKDLNLVLAICHFRLPYSIKKWLMLEIADKNASETMKTPINPFVPNTPFIRKS